MRDAAEWSDELDALRFAVPGHGATCAVHRLAFKALLKGEPDQMAVLEYFQQHSVAFIAAAKAKIARLDLPLDRSLHLNSRDIRRVLAGEGDAVTRRICRVLDRGR